MSDGASVYECTSADEVIDLLQGGQGVFGIALGRVWREVEGELAHLPSERAEHEADATPQPGDELAPAAAAGWPDPPPGPRRARLVDWRPPLTPCGRDLDATLVGAPKGQTSPEPLRRKDHAGQAPLEHPAPRRCVTEGETSTPSALQEPP